ncbi:MAG: hypothetical protein IPP77_00800 [Bacteroidetes bacterium]|nr:hypothetical protein [Bacteroidota bacterium]
MKNTIVVLLLLLTASLHTYSQQSSAKKGVEINNKSGTVSGTKGGKAEVKKGEAGVQGRNGGKAVVNNKGTEIKNQRGAGVEAKKGTVGAHNSRGSGIGVDKKGLEIKNSKGGMTLEKRKFQIKSKRVNINLGKD